jgi:hypothetical protein
MKLPKIEWKKGPWSILHGYVSGLCVIRLDDNIGQLYIGSLTSLAQPKTRFVNHSIDEQKEKMAKKLANWLDKI